MAVITVKDTNANALVLNSKADTFDLPNTAPTTTEIDLQGASIVSSARNGDDLVIELSNGKKIVLEDFFIELADGAKHKLLVDSGEGLVQATFSEAANTSPASGEAVTTSAVAVPGLNALAGLLGLGAAAGAGGGSSAEEVAPTPVPVVTSTTSEMISGTGEPGATVSIDLDGDGEADLTALVSEEGTWEVEGTFEDGDVIVVSQTLENGAESLPTDVTVDLVAPDAPEIDPTNGDVINGTGEPGATVTVSIEGIEEPLTAIVDEDGNWSVDPEEDLPHGTVISATQTDLLGNEGEDATAQTDSEAPGAPDINPTNGTVVDGTAEPLATVELSIPGQEPVTVQADEDGNWTYTPEVSLAHDVVVSATQTDLAGNTGEAAQETVDAVAPNAPAVDLSDGNTISGMGEPNTTVLINYEGLDEPLEAAVDLETGEWTIDVSPELPHETVLMVTLVDAAGNVSDITESTVDALHPDAPVINPTQGDIISGTGEPGTVLSLEIDGFEEPFIVDVLENGTWSVDPDPETSDFLPHATGLTATLTDAAGNVSEATEGASDSEPPLAPGIDPTDGTVLTGTSEPFATITLTIEDQLDPVTVEANEEGVWSYTPPEQLPNETGFTATQTDLAGNTGPFAAEQTDSEPPLAPEFNPSGPESISGTGEEGAEISVTFAGFDGEMTATVDEDGNWAIDPEEIPEGIVEGTILIGTQTDAAGNTSPIGTEVVDTGEPQPFTVDPSDGSLISGTGEPGSEVTLTSEAFEGPITVIVGEDGTFSVPFDPALPHETVVNLSQVDPAGNEGEPLQVETDDEAPSAPTIDPTDGTEITGTSDEEGATISVTYPGLSAPLTATVVGGVWSVTPPEAIADGIEVTATQSDAAGNESDTATETVDADAPAAPGIDPTDGNFLTGTGETGAVVSITYPGLEEPFTADVVDGVWAVDPEDLPEGGIPDGTIITATQADDAGNTSPAETETVDDTNPPAPFINPTNGTAITGTGEPGAEVTVEVQTQDVVFFLTATVDEDGNWVASEDLNLDHNDLITAYQTDAAGNQSPTDTENVDNEAPDAPGIDPTNGTVITGQGEEGATVSVTYPGLSAPLTTTVEGGVWSVTPPEAIANGIEVTATQTDEAGNTSPEADEVVDAIAPDAPGIDPTNGTSLTGTSDEDDGVIVSVTYPGLSDPFIAEVVDGVWTVDPEDLPDGGIPNGVTVTATQTDPAGNLSPAATEVVDAEAPVVTIDELVTGTDTVVTGTGEPNGTVLIYAGTDTDADPIGEVETDEDGNWTFTPETPLGDDAILTATQTDAAGNTGETEQVVALDLDGDGIRNTIDIDDDADGILDVNEISIVREQQSNLDSENVLVESLSSPAQSRFVGDLVDGRVVETIRIQLESADGEPVTTSITVASGGGTVTSNSVVVSGEPAVYEFTFDTDAQVPFDGESSANIITIENIANLNRVALNNQDVESPWIEGVSTASVSVAIEVNFLSGTDNTDGDDYINSLDTDSDNGGVSDNIEAQYGQTYVAPTGIDSDGDGLDDAYDETPDSGSEGSIGLIPSAANGSGIADFVEGEPGSDTAPVAITNGLTSGASGTGVPGAIITLTAGEAEIGTALVDEDGNWSADFDPALAEDAEITATQSDVPHFAGTENEDDTSIATAVAALDTDGDGVSDSVDIDDDNDGIIDTNEGPIYDTSVAGFWFDNSDATNPGLGGFAATANGDISATNAQGVTFSTDDGEADLVYTLVLGEGQTADTFELYGKVGGGLQESVRDYDLEITNTAGEVVFTGSNSIPEPTNYNAAQPSIDLTGFELTEGAYSVKVTVRSPMTREENPYHLRTDMELAEVRFTDGGSPLTFSGASAPVFTEDSDGDTIIDSLDTDSDNGGLSDNVEAQFGQEYIAPTGLDSDGDGLDDAYDQADGVDGSIGLVPVDTNNDGLADYVDGTPGSDTQPAPVITEALTSGVEGTGVPGAQIVVSQGDSVLGTAIVDEDGNWTLGFAPQLEESSEITAAQTIPNTEGPAGEATAELELDTDGDGVGDSTDIDDDNDGILDVNETTRGELGEFTDLTTGRSLYFNHDGVGLPGGLTENNASEEVISASAITFGPDLQPTISDTNNQYDDMYQFAAGTAVETTIEDAIAAGSYIDFSFTSAGNPDRELAISQIGTPIDVGHNGQFAVFVNGEFFGEATSINHAATVVTPAGGPVQILNGEENNVRIVLYNDNANGGLIFDGFNITLATAEYEILDNADGDEAINSLDDDSDNGGVSDNAEAQYGQNYIAPSGIDADGDGLDDAYDANLDGAENSVGLVPVDLDGDGTADVYQDGELPLTIDEALTSQISGTGLPGATITVSTDADGDLGTAEVGEDGTWSLDITPADPVTVSEGETLTATQTHLDFAGADGVATADAELDTDFDGVIDTIDIDDDGDGLLDAYEDSYVELPLDGIAEIEVVSGFVDTNGDSLTPQFLGNLGYGSTNPNGLALWMSNGIVDGSGSTVYSGVVDVPLDTDRIAEGAETTFSIYVGKHPFYAVGNYGITLVADGVAIGTLTGAAPTTTEFEQHTLTMSLTAEQLSSDLALRLDVPRNANPVADRFGYVHFDDVTYGALASDDNDDNGTLNSLQVDSDGGGIGDNIEAQYQNAEYVAPSGEDVDGDGLDDAYDQNLSGAANSIGLVADDLDNNGTLDFAETQGVGDTDTLPLTMNPLFDGAEITGTGVVGATITLSTDPADTTIVGEDGTWSITPVTPIADGTEVTATQSDADHLPGATSAVTETLAIDTDGDGIANSLDIDDDDDGILDYNEVETDTVAFISGVAEGTRGIRISDADVSNLVTYDGSNYASRNATNGTFGIRERGAGTTLNIARTIEFELPVSDVELQFSGIGGGTRFGRFDVTYADGTKQEDLSFAVVDTNGLTYLQTFNGDSVIRGGSTGTASNNTQGTGTVRFLDLDPDLRILSITFQQLSKPSGTGTLSAAVRPKVPTTDVTVDTDGDGVANYRDVDADDGGASDNVEAQHGEPFVEASGVDANNNGLDDAYDRIAPDDLFGLNEADNDGDGTADYRDTVFDLNAALEADLEGGALTFDGGHTEVAFDGTGLTLDLTSLDNDVFTNVETIDLTGSGDNSLTLNLSDLVDLSPDSDALFVKGDAGDTVVADGNFAANGSAGIDGVNYNIYVDGTATLFVEDTVNVSLI